MSTTRWLQIAGNYFDLLHPTWTIEMWALTNATNTYYPALVSIMNSSGSWFKIRMNDTGFITVNTPSSPPHITSSVALTAGQFTHIALVRRGQSIFLYLNGTQRATSSSIPVWDNVIFESIAIGNSYNNSGGDTSTTFNGEISQLHISKKALYWSNFTPSKDLYPTDISSSMFF